MAVSLNNFGDQIELSKKATMVFSASERNKVLIAAMEMAGQYWIDNYLPKRYDIEYMRRAPFNHHTNQLSLKQKMRKAYFQQNGAQLGRGRRRLDFSRLQPLVMSGLMMYASLTRSRVVARAPGGRIKGVVKIPTAHAIHDKVSALIKTMPNREQHTMANIFGKAVADMINASSAKRTKGGKVSRTGKRTMTGATSQIRSKKMTGAKNG